MICPHGYKSNIVGLVVARRLGVPIVSVSHGWTGQSLRVKVFEKLDQWALRWMDRVVCVSAGQAEKARSGGVPNHKIVVIHDAVRSDRFSCPSSDFRKRLEEFFPSKPKLIIGEWQAQP